MVSANREKLHKYQISTVRRFLTALNFLRAGISTQAVSTNLSGFAAMNPAV
jgi:hypothetical protein